MAQRHEELGRGPNNGLHAHGGPSPCPSRTPEETAGFLPQSEVPPALTSGVPHKQGAFCLSPSSRICPSRPSNC